MNSVKQNEVVSRHILSKSGLPGTGWTVNPYIGCLHGCVYCYACFMRRFTGHLGDNWGQFVDAKTNAADLFPADFRRVKSGDSIFFGSVTDAYQPIERKYRLTRRMLQFLAEEARRDGSRLDEVDISILTKSDLVLRDLEFIKLIPNIKIGFSIAMPDEKARKIFEPCASPVRQRMSALDVLHREGIKTFVFMGPVLPYITPVSDLFEKIVGSTDFVYGEGLNTRCRNMPQILAAVQRYNPRLYVPFLESVKSHDYWDSMENNFINLAQGFGIPVEGFFRHDQSS